MREPEKIKIDYIGYSSPQTEDEVELEILGLKLAIVCAEQRIALLNQGLKVARMKEKAAHSQKESNDK